MQDELIGAVQKGDEVTVARILAKHPEMAGTCNENGVSLIFVALYHRQEAVAQRLAREVKGLSLHEAAALGALDALRTQLNGETALVNTFTADGFTALHLACFFARVEAVKMLLARGADPRVVTANDARLYPLNSAAAGGSCEIVAMLLHAGVAVDAVQTGGVTALMSAGATGNRAMADLLLKHGADVTRRSDTGHTAAAYAQQRGFPGLATYLEAHA